MTIQEEIRILNEFNAYLEEQVANHSIYVWGAQGQKSPAITEAWIKSRETSASYASKAIAFWKKQIAKGFEKLLRAFDCSGLGMYFFYNLKKIFDKDMNSNSMKNSCTKISKGDLKCGDWVFCIYKSGANKDRAYHIGYVSDDGLNVIEARGRDYGVVKRKLSEGSWNYYGRPKILANAITSGGVQPPYVEIIGKDVNVRDTNSTAGKVLGYVSKGARLPYISVSSTGWYVVHYNGKMAYISNREDLTKVVGADTPTVPAKWTLSRLLKLKDPYMRGDDVESLQRALNAAGFDCGDVDGIFGAKTDKAVKAFQKAKGLEVDGIVGKDTCTALGGVWTK